MKFLKIKYYNYRCFLDLELSFETQNSKNIVMIVAPNGGGKTEMLFSFWWVLYGFDFKKLKGKENTPYALNSAFYHNLQNTNDAKEAHCGVDLVFEADGTEYTVKRREKYTKTSQGITIVPSVSLSYVNPNGEDSLPIENSEDVEKILTRIIPPKILSGIIFDGERMKQLSSIDEDSKNAVEGVIKHITNEELFEICKTEFEEVKDAISKDLRKVSKDNKNLNLNTIVNQIATIDSQKSLCEIQKDGKEESLNTIIAELEEISTQLEQHRDSKVYEQQRKQLKKELEEKKADLDNAVEGFYNELWYGYTLIGQELVSEVRNFLQKEDLPWGLTAEAVRNILNKPLCICGNKICEHEREILTALISKLPPENINSTLLEMTCHADIDAGEKKQVILKSYQTVKSLEDAIEIKKKDIDHISTLITDGASEKIANLERRRAQLESDKTKIKLEIDKLQASIAQYEKQSEDLIVKRNSVAKADASTNYLTKKDEFIRKCLKALTAIDEYNKKVSLKDVNSRINDAYAILSEDYARGKRLYVIQFDKEDKYGMVSYLQSQYDDLYTRFSQDNTIASYKASGLTDEEIAEKIILKIRESNSTGQSKINTLSFAKAMLDYSSEVRDNDSIELTKSYPFLIDSPFTELSQGNLEMSARNIHTFSEQIILMISDISLASVDNIIRPFIAKTYTLTKKVGESNSSLIR